MSFAVSGGACEQSSTGPKASRWKSFAKQGGHSRKSTSMVKEQFGHLIRARGQLAPMGIILRRH